MIREILNICIFKTFFGPKVPSTLLLVCRSTADERETMEKSEKKWFGWRIQNMIETFNKLIQQFDNIASQLLFPFQVTRKLEYEQTLFVEVKQNVLCAIEKIISELLIYPQLLQNLCVYQTEIFMSEILNFLRHQLDDDILFKQPNNFHVLADFQLNHELLKNFIKIMSRVDFLGETKEVFQNRCIQLLSEKLDLLYRDNLMFLSSYEIKNFRMQITELELLVKHQMQPLKIQADYFEQQNTLIHEVISRTYHYYSLLNFWMADQIDDHEEELKKLQIKLLSYLLFPWMADMYSSYEYDIHRLDSILKYYLIEERSEVLLMLMN